MITYQITFNEKTEFGKNLIELFQNNKRQIKVKEEKVTKTKKDPTLLTEEEFDAKIQEARVQYERGECKELKYEDIDKFLGLE